MPAKILTLTRWEWFKLRKRWMPWVLILIALAFSQLGIWGPYFAYQAHKGQTVTLNSGNTGIFGRLHGTAAGPAGVNCNQVLAGDTSSFPAGTGPAAQATLVQACQARQAANALEQQNLADTFTLPGSVPQGLGIAARFSIILVAVMTASVIGTEYGWGTLRMVMARGTGRRAFLATKLLVIAIGTLLLMVLLTVFAMISGAIAGSLAGTSHSFFSLGFLGNVGLDIGKAWFSLWPFIAVAALVAVLARSTAAGMAAGIGYYIGEGIVSGLMTGLFDWFQHVSNYLLVENDSAWMRDLRLQAVPTADQTNVSISELHAFIVLAVYIVALTAVAFWLFQRRDITSSGGG